MSSNDRRDRCRECHMPGQHKLQCSTGRAADDRRESEKCGCHLPARDVDNHDDDRRGSECTTPCDDDCEVTCHEGHAVSWKRSHEPENCPGADDRRERYAAAMHSETGGAVTSRELRRVDAAMAEADAEQRELRATLSATNVYVDKLFKEHARLRAELNEAQETIRDLRANQARLRSELEVVRTEMVTQGQENSAYGRELDRLRAEIKNRITVHNEDLATIDRVEALADDESDDYRVSVAIIRAALNDRP